jgi:hypothetical protein
MNCSSPSIPPACGRPIESTPPIASNALERLAQLMISNDRLMDELVISRARIVTSKTYLDKPDRNLRFGLAHLERCRSKHSGILAQLRANRIEALQLLGADTTSG